MVPGKMAFYVRKLECHLLKLRDVHCYRRTGDDLGRKMITLF